jgi:hypothetical protein
MFYDLLSVVCCINSDSLMIYKLGKDGKRRKWRHLDACRDSWFSLLSVYDFGTIDNMINTR